MWISGPNNIALNGNDIGVERSFHIGVLCAISILIEKVMPGLLSYA